MASHIQGDIEPAHPIATGDELREAVPQQFNSTTKKLVKRHDMTWHDHLIMLLHLGSAIEHALMVQYLYAAYSLGGEQVPVDYRPMVQEWQETILSVAREEMGHLLTVQNLLTLLGAGVNLDRENFPWDIAYYPFPFILEPFTRGSLACYVYAEMPIAEQFPERDEIEKLARDHAKEIGHRKDTVLHPVGEIYSEIIDLIGDESRIPDVAFNEQSISVQASWDDWGRRYGPAPIPLDAQGNLDNASAKPKTTSRVRANLLIDQVATRTQALATLTALSIQGEGPDSNADDGELSHFQRFIKIFRDYEKIKDEPWSPSRRITRNPNTVDLPGAPDREGYIESSRTRNWANLFNTRYRLLLNYLAHTFRLARVTRPDEPSVRAVLMHRVFGEMYNLKTIAGILVQLPLKDGNQWKTAPQDVTFAGPPFEMPFSLSLPPGEADAWHNHLDVLGSADSLCKCILAQNPRHEDKAYIETLFDLDGQTRTLFKTILAGLEKTERYPV
jgi:hypothetical protein